MQAHTFVAAENPVSDSITAENKEPATGTINNDDVSDTEAEKQERKNADLKLQLTALSSDINKGTRQLKKLNQRLRQDRNNTELQQEIVIASQDLDLLKKSFEQLAIGGISLDVFSTEEQSKDWREELAIVVKPLLENLNHLTEKPRKQESLRRIISAQKIAIESADKALISLNKMIADKPSQTVTQQLVDVQEKWRRLKNDAQRQQQLANYELDNLNGERSHWFKSLTSSISHFARERGLTLLLAVLASLMVWFFFRSLRWLFERNRKQKYQQRTTYRIINYAQKLITVALIIMSILIVFFIRGDILLLAIMAVLLFAIAIGLRNLLPQFVEESRLILNIGAVRENEYVMLNGVPWRIASINVFSKLVNPEIRGVIRLPLSELKNLNSRPVANEKWFPSSIGDWILDDTNKLYEVIEQNPNSVELQSAQGTNKLVPTDIYYASGFVNLTRSKRIRIVSRFGLDYQLQAIALDQVPQKMQIAIQNYLENADLGTTDIEARVEFEKAGESSLDYLIIVQLGSTAAKSYYRVERSIQQACVSVCNAESWSIPFPHMVVQKHEMS